MTRAAYVGIDPIGLVGLDDTITQYVQRIDLAWSSVRPIADRNSDWGVGLVDIRLVSIGAKLTASAANLRWRADTIERAQYVGSRHGELATTSDWIGEFAARAVFSVDGWHRTFGEWRAQESLTRLSGMTPTEVARHFTAMLPDAAESLARRYPSVIGRMDGVPPEYRYKANDRLIEDWIRRLEAMSDKLVGSSGVVAEGDPVAGVVAERLAQYRSWLAEDRQILLFDPAGDGRVIEVFGDLAAADSIAVVVPGMANDIRNFSTLTGGFRMNAGALFAASNTERTATIAWLGYDTPDGIDAAARTAAEAGAPDLARFVQGIDAGQEKTVTVVAHSYGSVVAGLAAGAELAADNLVFVGSPGTTLDHATQANLRSGGRVWSALADGDPIGLGVDPLASYRWWHGLIPFAPALATPLPGEHDELWHGTNPVSNRFGSLRITTDGASGHSSYFEAGALENLTAILEGRYSAVGLAG